MLILCLKFKKMVVIFGTINKKELIRYIPANS